MGSTKEGYAATRAQLVEKSARFLMAFQGFRLSVFVPKLGCMPWQVARFGVKKGSQSCLNMLFRRLKQPRFAQKRRLTSPLISFV